MITIEDDLRHLQRAVELAAAALEAGDDPFGSLLVARDGTVLAEELNREASSGDPTAHAWVGLGKVVFAASSVQLAEWRTGWGLPASPVAVLPIRTVAPGVPVVGPVPPLDEAMRVIQERAASR